MRLTFISFAVCMVTWCPLSNHGHIAGDRSMSIPLVVLRLRNCCLGTQKKVIFLRWVGALAVRFCMFREMGAGSETWYGNQESGWTVRVLWCSSLWGQVVFLFSSKCTYIASCLVHCKGSLPEGKVAAGIGRWHLSLVLRSRVNGIVHSVQQKSSGLIVHTSR